MLVWDNVRPHLTADSREDFAANTDWLTVFQLPAHAPDPNPCKGVRSMVKHDLGNLGAADLGQITRTVKCKLKMLQYRPRLLDGCLIGTAAWPSTRDQPGNLPPEHAFNGIVSPR